MVQVGTWDDDAIHCTANARSTRKRQLYWLNKDSSHEHRNSRRVQGQPGPVANYFTGDPASGGGQVGEASLRG